MPPAACAPYIIACACICCCWCIIAAARGSMLGGPPGNPPGVGMPGIGGGYMGPAPCGG